MASVGWSEARSWRWKRDVLGLTWGRIAKDSGVSERTVRRWVERHRKRVGHVAFVASFRPESLRRAGEGREIRAEEWREQRERLRREHDEQGYTWRQIAQAHGLTADTVRKRVYRARLDQQGVAEARSDALQRLRAGGEDDAPRLLDVRRLQLTATMVMGSLAVNATRLTPRERADMTEQLDAWADRLQQVEADDGDEVGHVRAVMKGTGIGADESMERLLETTDWPTDRDERSHVLAWLWCRAASLDAQDRAPMDFMSSYGISPRLYHWLRDTYRPEPSAIIDPEGLQWYQGRHAHGRHLRMIDGSTTTQADLARRLGCSQSRISRAVAAMRRDTSSHYSQLIAALEAEAEKNAG